MRPILFLTLFIFIQNIAAQDPEKQWKLSVNSLRGRQPKKCIIELDKVKHETPLLTKKYPEFQQIDLNVILHMVKNGNDTVWYPVSFTLSEIEESVEHNIRNMATNYVVDVLGKSPRGNVDYFIKLIQPHYTQIIFSRDE